MAAHGRAVGLRPAEGLADVDQLPVHGGAADAGLAAHRRLEDLDATSDGGCFTADVDDVEGAHGLGGLRFRVCCGSGRSVGVAGADDRRGRVFVNAVGFADFDVREPRGGEPGAELLLGQRTRDATRVRGEIGSGGLVHVRAGDDV